MIRECAASDFDSICEIINDAAQAYKGVIPADCWTEPNMPEDELRLEMEAGVRFLGYEENEELIGVMGLQEVQDVTLIRHAYVRTARRNQGIGGRLLSNLVAPANRPVLIGTWAAAAWAIRFYENRGFQPGSCAGEGPAVAKVLVCTTAADGDVRSPGGQKVVCPR